MMGPRRRAGKAAWNGVEEPPFQHDDVGADGPMVRSSRGVRTRVGAAGLFPTRPPLVRLGPDLGPDGLRVG